MKPGFKFEDAVGGASALLETLANDQQFKRAASLAVSMTICRNIAERMAKSNIAAAMEAQLKDIYDLYVLNNGDRDDVDNADWDSGIDDLVETFVEPYSRNMTATWLGTHTIDTRLHIDGEIRQWAESFAFEAWRVLCHNHDEDDAAKQTRTTAQILSGCGVVRDDIETLMAERGTTSPEKEKENIMDDLHRVLNAVHAHFGGIPDIMSCEPLFDNLLDDDDGLSMSGAAQLGLTADHRDTVHMWAMSYTGTETKAEALTNMLASAPYAVAEAPEIAPGAPQSAPPPPPPAPPRGTPPNPSVTVPPRKSGRPKTDHGNPALGIPARAFALLRENITLKDEDVANGLGISRQTYINYAKGKGFLVADDAQRNYILSILNASLAALTEAKQIVET